MWPDGSPFDVDARDVGTTPTAGQSATQPPDNGQTNTDAEENETVPKADFLAAQARVSALEKQLETITNTLMSPQYLAALRGHVAGQGQRGGVVEEEVEAAPPAKPEPEPDFSTMKPKEIVDYIVKVVKQEIRKEVGPQLEDARTSADLVRARQEIADCAAKYPDFFLYKDAIIAVGKEKEAQGVVISVEDAYHIAKGRARSMFSGAGRTAPTTPSGGTSAKPAAAAAKPTEKSGVAPGTTAETRLSTREAAEKAFAQIFGS